MYHTHVGKLCVYLYTCIRMCICMHAYTFVSMHRVCSLFGGGFDMAVWKFFCVHQIYQFSFIAITCIAAITSRQIKETPTAITDRFTKYFDTDKSALHVMYTQYPQVYNARGHVLIY